MHPENETLNGPEQATVAAILQRFRAFMRYAPMWQEPGILGVEVTMSQAKCLFVASLHPGLSVSALAAHLGDPDWSRWDDT